MDEARERLGLLWGDPDDGEEVIAEAGDEPAALPELVPGPREGQREAVQASALLEKAERLLERVQPEDRAEVEALMEKVRTALADRQWDRVTQAGNELADALFYLEG
jgi:molecular chaperone DnaK